MGPEALEIVGLGLATLDVLVRFGELPTWERGAPMSAFALDGGGPVATALVAAARLGVRVGLVGTGGSDEVAELKMRTLTREGIDLTRFVRRPEPEMNVILVYVDERTGERVFSGLRHRSDSTLRPEELDRDYITSAAYLHLDGHHRAAALQAARWMHHAGKAVVYDGVRAPGQVSDDLLQLIHEVDYLIGGSGFCQALTGRADLWEAGEAALTLGPQVVVQTEGEQGSYTITADERFYTPAYTVDVVDTTGAGDVFHGAYLVGLLKGWDLATIATFASAVAALKCTTLGGRKGIPCFDETLRFLRAHGHDTTRMETP